jgi:ribosomal protein L37AE/L43A
VDAEKRITVPQKHICAECGGSLKKKTISTGIDVATVNNTKAGYNYSPVVTFMDEATRRKK